MERDLTTIVTHMIIIKKNRFYIQNSRSFPLYVEHLGPNHGLSVVVESYFGLDDFSKNSDFKLYIHQSGSIPDMLNSTTIEVPNKSL